MTPADMADLHARVFSTPRPWSAEEFQSLLDSPLVFATGDQTAFAMGRVVADEAELLTIVTDPARRRQGLGQAQLSQFEEISRERGATSAFLEVAADNSAAIALYRAQGFEQTGLRKGYYCLGTGTSVDALTMTKAL